MVWYDAYGTVERLQDFGGGSTHHVQKPTLSSCKVRRKRGTTETTMQNGDAASTDDVLTRARRAFDTLHTP